MGSNGNGAPPGRERWAARPPRSWDSKHTPVDARPALEADATEGDRLASQKTLLSQNRVGTAVGGEPSQ